MNYAASHHIGHITNTRKKTAKTTAPTVNSVQPLDEKAKRCRRSPKRQTKVCSPEQAPDGFLRTTFLPRLKVEQSVQAGEEAKNLERNFHISLSRLSEHYGIVPMSIQDFEYPYYIALSLSDIQQKLKDNVAHWDSIRFVQQGTKAFLISEERYSTGSTLYYIPVAPLFLMLKDRSKKKSAHLLLSVCAYLYHIADIPYYRQEDSYLYWQYEMLTDWLELDDETEETHINTNEIKQAEWVGERMEQKLFNRKNLEVFKDRLRQFKSTNDFDKECLQIATKALELYECYPEEKFFRNANAQDWEDEDHDNDNILTIEKYISFYHHHKGWLSDSLFDTVNNEFAEYGEIEEPTISKCFDGKPLINNNLDFENLLFSVLDDLIYLLSNYKFKHHE